MYQPSSVNEIIKSVIHDSSTFSEMDAFRPARHLSNNTLRQAFRAFLVPIVAAKISCDCHPLFMEGREKSTSQSACSDKCKEEATGITSPENPDGQNCYFCHYWTRRRTKEA